MGRVQSPELARDFLNFQFSEKVAVQDVHTGSIALAQNSKVRYVLWRYVKEKWDVVSGKLAGRNVVTDRYFKNTLNKFADLEVERDISGKFDFTHSSFPISFLQSFCPSSQTPQICFCNAEIILFAEFFATKDTKGYDRGLLQVSEAIRGNARYKERDEKVIEEWLGAHGYL